MVVYWSKNRIIPDCYKSWSNNKRAIIRNPNSTRPWQHVLKAVISNLVLAIKLKKNPNYMVKPLTLDRTLKRNYKGKRINIYIRKSWKILNGKIKI